MESECECCGENTNNYYFGMCAGCIRTLPLKDKRIAELEAKLEALEAENKRLREAAEAVMRHRGIHRYFKPMDVAIDALIALLEEADAPDR